MWWKIGKEVRSTIMVRVDGSDNEKGWIRRLT